MTTSRFKDFSLQAAFMGVIAAFTGFASTFAVVLQGLTSVGASPEEAASGLMVMTIGMGVCGALLAWWTRDPVNCAWSTPSMAFLATSAVPQGGFPVAVGAFILCGLGIIAAGLIKPVGRFVSAIPTSIANAMLAGVLLALCVAPFQAIAMSWLLGLPIFLSWLIVGAFNKLLAVPAALLVFIIVVLVGVPINQSEIPSLAEAFQPDLVLVRPNFVPQGVISLGVPLFIIAMASQNIPGSAVMKSNGYKVRAPLWFNTTGIFSLLVAPFGGATVVIAAITAAMMAGEDCHEDPKKRYWASIVAGGFYVLFGLLAAGITAFVVLAPVILIKAVAGLALIGAFYRASHAAFEKEEDREAAAVTFLMTASGITIAGISGAFWGLIAGGAVMVVKRFASRSSN